jgi:FAD/FMN-containing dehydrogenase
MIKPILTRRTLLVRLFGLCSICAGGVFRTSGVLAQGISKGLLKIKGRIISRGDQDYESWRASMVWYIFKPKRYPDTIAHVQNEQDVIKAVNYAREHKLKIAVRSTGHHITGTALRDGGILIDLSQLNGIEVNQLDATGWIEPGLRSVELVAQLNQHGLTFPAAHTAVVGMGGFLLGGGLGWNLQQVGVSCHSVIAADIVTADGKKVTATEDENQELLWALRGGGPTFFGIVTRLKLKLYPLSKRMVKNTYIFKHDQLSTATRLLDDLIRSKDQRVEVLTILKHSADVGAVSVKGVVFIVNFIAFVESQSDVDSVFSPFENSALSKISIFRKERVDTNYSELYAAQSVTDGTSQFRTTSENIWTDEPSKALQSLSGHFVKTESKYSFVLAVYGVKGMPENKTSSPHFADNYVVCTLVADDEKDVDLNFRWMDDAVQIMKPLSKGRYINEVDARRYPEHVRECFTDEGWERMNGLRDKYDPDGVFFTYPGIS